MFPSQTFPQKYFVCKSYLKIKLIRCTILNVCLFWIFQFVFFSVKYHTLCLYLQPQSTYFLLAVRISYVELNLKINNDKYYKNTKHNNKTETGAFTY